ncbi:hypothetical protein ACJX0J_039635, partial [Zea mays]
MVRPGPIEVRDRSEAYYIPLWHKERLTLYLVQEHIAFNVCALVNEWEMPKLSYFGQKGILTHISFYFYLFLAYPQALLPLELILLTKCEEEFFSDMFFLIFALY